MNGSLRIALAALVLGVLAGCAARTPPPPATPPLEPAQLPWTAAIGQLVLPQGDRPCTAILVAQNMIVTAAHCLFQRAQQADIAASLFRPNFGSTPDLGQYRGRSLHALGGLVREGHLAHIEDVAADWALIEIEPADRGVVPVPIVALTTQQIVSRLAAGDGFFTAGYGYGGGKALRPHGKCRVMAPGENQLSVSDRMLVTDCIIRIGDSGGPLALIDRHGRPSLVGIFSGFGRNEQTGFAFATNAGNFAGRLGPVLLSFGPMF